MAQRNEVVKLLETLREKGADDSDILEHLVYNWFSSDDAFEGLADYANDHDYDIEEDE